MKLLIFPFVLLAALSCTSGNSSITPINTKLSNPLSYDSGITTIHILVALCDNQYQGIVPVPKGIGNGQQPHSNLYWGCSYGIKSFFKKSKDWKLVKTITIDTTILERLVFKHTTKNVYLIADAYNGEEIQQCTIDYLQSLSGSKLDTLVVNNKSIGLNANAKLLAYIGHDGLMDFSLTETFTNTDGKKRDAIILACYSKKYFTPYVQQAKANPLVWTTGLMCPEAYTVHDAINSYLANENNTAIQKAAAKAYSKYQHCSEKAAGSLLVTGW